MLFSAYNLHFDELKSSFGLVVFGPFLFSNGTNNTDNRLTISLEYVAKVTMIVSFKLKLGAFLY